jgi:hypothetical protein
MPAERRIAELAASRHRNPEIKRSLAGSRPDRNIP